MTTPLDPATNGREIVASLRRARWQTEFALPNFTPLEWWECDLFVLTKSGYFREFEVKISRSDFLRDGEKSAEVGPWKWGEKRPTERKHDLLASGSTRAPYQFWYVTPPGVLTAADLPPWAGLIEMVGNGPNFYERQVVEAPRIHRVKADPKIRAHALEACYWRMHRALR